MWTLAHQLVTDINPPISVRIRPQAHQLNMLSTWPSISPPQSPVSTEYKRWKFLFYYCFPMVSRINQTFVFLPQENNNSLNKVNPSSVSPKCVIRLNDIRNKTWELNILPMFGRAENATCTTNPPSSCWRCQRVKFWPSPSVYPLENVECSVLLKCK